MFATTTNRSGPLSLGGSCAQLPWFHTTTTSSESFVSAPISAVRPNVRDLS